MEKQIITLSGFGEFYENDEGAKNLFLTAKKHGVECYATYYDHELKGEADAIEKVTEELWSMSREEWADNGLIETLLTDLNKEWIELNIPF